MADKRYMINDDGITFLKALADGVMDSQFKINAAVNDANQLIDEYQGMLGPHVRTLKSAMDGISSAVSSSSDSLQDASEALEMLADHYQSILDDDPFSGIDAGPQRVRRR